LGKALPNKIYQRGQNRRYADFGTVVESCSKKLPLSSAALVCGYTGLLHQYSDCSGVFCPLFTTITVKRVRFGKRSGNFFIFPVCSLQPSGGVVCQRFLKMGAKKQQTFFKIYCLSAAVMGGGIAVLNYQRSKRNFNRLSISRPTICSCISVLICPSIFAQKRIYPA